MELPRPELADVAREFASKHVEEARWIGLLAFGPRALSYGSPSDELELLLVAHGVGPKVKHVQGQVEQAPVSLTIVDGGIFKSDVRRGLLGELLADKLLVPYVPIFGRSYLFEREVELKERLVRELVLDLAANFQAFSLETLLDPRYFLYETINRMGRIMPLSAFMFANVLGRPSDRHRHEPSIMRGFNEALKRLVEAGWVKEEEGLIRLRARALKATRMRFLSSLALGIEKLLRGLRKYATRAATGLVRPYILEREVFLRRFGAGAQSNPLWVLPKPDDFFFLRTKLGLRPALKEVALEEVASAIGPVGGKDDVIISEVGGSLNLVCLVTVRGELGSIKLIVKKFRSWDNLKWLSLRLWVLGAKKFTISGRERLRREYTMCRLLNELGFRVPEIYHVDLKNNTLVEEFIDGVALSELIKAFLFGEAGGEGVLEPVRRAGRVLASVHRAGIAVGDCKPENFIVEPSGRIALIDLEQASRGGDYSWDVAEFLYYAGHYVPSVSSAEAFKAVAEAFVRGYIEAGGIYEAVKEAPSVKFARIFSVFTPPQVIEAIYELCEGAREWL